MSTVADIIWAGIFGWALVMGPYLLLARRHDRGRVRRVQAADGHIVTVRHGPRNPFAEALRDVERADADALARTVAEWLADERPAWETVAAFEADVERALLAEGERPVRQMGGGLSPVPPRSRRERDPRLRDTGRDALTGYQSADMREDLREAEMMKSIGALRTRGELR